MLKVVSNESVEFNLDEFIRQGARKILKEALNVEVLEYVEKFKSERDERGKRLVTRNGVGKTRSLTTSAGAFEIEAPRVNDRRDGERFTSQILPPYLRKSPKIESLLPILYLKGISTGKIGDVLKEHFGEGSLGLSPATLVKLIRKWETEFNEWRTRSITSNYVYIWVDGVNVKVRLGDDKKICLLVVIGVKEDGSKELIAVQNGFRESKESWSTLLRDLLERGFKAPLVAVADGALGFWSAIRDFEEFENTKEQRCWVHKIKNVMDKLPKRIQSEIKSQLHDMMRAKDVETAEKIKKRFVRVYGDKYPKAVDCLVKDWKPLTVFFDYPAEHWISLRTTNPIESSFATVKLRTKVTKGSGSPEAAAALAFKLLLECEKKWRRIKGHKEISNLLKGVEYKDGVMVAQKPNREGAVI